MPSLTKSMLPEKASYANFALNANKRSIETNIRVHCLLSANQHIKDNVKNTNNTISTQETPLYSRTSGLKTNIHIEINTDAISNIGQK